MVAGTLESGTGSGETGWDRVVEDGCTDGVLMQEMLGEAVHTQ